MFWTTLDRALLLIPGYPNCSCGIPNGFLTKYSKLRQNCGLISLGSISPHLMSSFCTSGSILLFWFMTLNTQGVTNIIGHKFDCFFKGTFFRQKCCVLAHLHFAQNGWWSLFSRTSNVELIGPSRIATIRKRKKRIRDTKMVSLQQVLLTLNHVKKGWLGRPLSYEHFCDHYSRLYWRFSKLTRTV